MKKFSFSLETILNYDQQVLDNLRNEHAAILEQIERQKKKIEEIQAQYLLCAQTLREQEQKGITVQQIFTYENYMDTLIYQTKQEQEVLKLIYKQEEVKRQQVIDAKRESASVEKLKEKKLQVYSKEVQKEQEQLVEEFVSNMRIKNQAAIS